MKIVDLSHPIMDGVPTFTGAFAPEFEWRSTFEKKGRCSSVVRLSTHTATHVDAPLHFIADGQPVEELSLESLFGEAHPIFVGDLPLNGRFVDDAAFRQRAAGLQMGDIAVVYSNLDCLFGQPAFTDGFPVLAAASVEWLLQMKIRAYATDAPAVDAMDSKEFANHKLLLSAGVPIVEGLANLDALQQQRFVLSALPLKLAGREGAPCRAVALCDISLNNE